MILARASGIVWVALLCGAVPAHADVMEVGPDGARWVNGVLAVQVPAAQENDMLAPEEPAIVELAADFSVPPQAIADAARQAGVVPAVYAAKVFELASRFDLSPALIEALVWQESRWNAGARSPVGARGLAQLMPGTARYLGVDPDDPFANLEGGARYLREQLDRFDGNIEKALAAYNAGPGRVIAANGIPRIRETQTYVSSIMGRLSDHSREKN
ncbi:lytic transglycosylase domain-containing protein [Tsuneonella amylolytica]|uniref:lytic transglycosylase domain-containing protein n=1 Tax=Tsuneonella amylolytica TaxID=2338327 RepID=UPI001F3DFEB5|nr:lytic transglycosylase domain-containing protein [Tsuneonella amylolytica]